MIHPEAKHLADAFRSVQAVNQCADSYVQIAGKDGHHWLMLSRQDLKALSRDEDLQAVCQAMLINRGLIKPPTNEEPHHV